MTSKTFPSLLMILFLFGPLLATAQPACQPLRQSGGNANSDTWGVAADKGYFRDRFKKQAVCKLLNIESGANVACAIPPVCKILRSGSPGFRSQYPVW